MRHRDGPVRGSAARHAPAAVGLASCVERATQELGSLRHPGEPEAGCRAGVAMMAVVVHAEVYALVVGRDPDGDVCCVVGVAASVGDRLLGEAVEGSVERRAQVA